MLERLVGGEAGTESCDLEQDAARLSKVDGFEVVPVDDRRRPRARRHDLVAPRGMVFEGRRPGDVVDGARAAHSTRVRRWVISIKGAALLAARLELPRPSAPESQRLLQGGAALRRARKGANAGEPLQGKLSRDLRMLGHQRG